MHRALHLELQSIGETKQAYSENKHKKVGAYQLSAVAIRYMYERLLEFVSIESEERERVRV